MQHFSTIKDMGNLDQLLLANEAILKCEVSEQHSHEVAKRIGDAWESLATFIGISNVEVDDIKVKYKELLDRRLAMMRRWHELWGKEATYNRLVEGLKQIGRRDLIDLILCKYNQSAESEVATMPSTHL